MVETSRVSPVDATGSSRRSKPSRSPSGFVSSIWTLEPDRDVSYAGHSAYRWYGTLPGPLVGRVLDLYAPQFVWDPMCGSGTTLVEARLRGISAEGWDVNPLACLVSRLKIDPMPGATGAVIDALHEVRHTIRNDSRIDDRFLEPTFSYARKWFGSASLERLLAVASGIARTTLDERVARLLYIALAATAKDVAEVDARCTHHLVRKAKPYIDAMPTLERRALALAELTASIPLADAAAGVTVAQRDALVEEPRETDLAIVHPPYLGVIHYHLIHRLSTEILRFVQEEFRPPTLDGLILDPEWIRRFDGSTDHASRYDAFLDGVVSQLERAVRSDGRAVVILGDARHKGHLRHPFTDAIGKMEAAGFLLEDLFIWVLQNNGGMHVLRRGHHIDHNYILVFHRP
jgi:DNA modification methylase